MSGIFAAAGVCLRACPYSVGSPGQPTRSGVVASFPHVRPCCWVRSVLRCF